MVERPDTSGLFGGESKQELLDALCAVAGLPAAQNNRGSSTPSHVVRALTERYRLPYRSMPQGAEAVSRHAGVAWDASCDSRGSVSGGGSTVTITGLRRLLKAVQRLESRGGPAGR